MTLTTAKPIFITGSDYGGKGYVYDMLKRHPDVFYRYKQWYWAGYQPDLARRFPNLENAEMRLELMRCHLESIHTENLELYPGSIQGSSEAFASEYAPVLAKALDHTANHDLAFHLAIGFVANRCGKTHYMQLATGQYIDRLAAHLPQAKFIAVIRDPRNMLVSRKTRRKNVWKSDQFKPEQRKLKHFMTAYDPLWDSFSAKSDIRAMQRSLLSLPDQMKLYHHPQLVTNPQAGAEAICEFLEVPFDNGLLDVERRTSANWDAKKAAKQDLTPRYRRMLHPSEIAISQSVLKQELAWLGYSLDTIRLRHRLLAPFLLVRSGWDLWLRIFRRWTLRGTGYIIDMFKMYLRRFRSIWQG